MDEEIDCYLDLLADLDSSLLGAPIFGFMKITPTTYYTYHRRRRPLGLRALGPTPPPPHFKRLRRRHNTQRLLRAGGGAPPLPLTPRPNHNKAKLRSTSIMTAPVPNCPPVPLPCRCRRPRRPSSRLRGWFTGLRYTA